MPSLTDLSTDLDCDVLVIGGGPSGTWAAIAAARSGADVVLVDKGYCGTSGAAAAAGVGAWYVPPTPAEHEFAAASREQLGGFLSDRRWVARVIDEVWVRMRELDAFGYPFSETERPRDDYDDPGGMGYRQGTNMLYLQGPDFMRVMRRQVRRAGVRILDHSPVLQLLVDGEGRVAGAHGWHRQAGGDYVVRAGATILATGGCAFQSNAIGCNVDTGDGYLFAAEVGSPLSGMEFSNAYGLGPKYGSASKGGHFVYGVFTRADGTPLEGAGVLGGRTVIARELLTGPVYCRFEGVNDEVDREMRIQQPNFMSALDKLGIDPRRERFEVDLILEGTVRGTGGVHLDTEDCATTVPGLFAVGDTATRQLLCGGFTGGGSHNVAWAVASGNFAGRAAAVEATRHGTRRAIRELHGSGRMGLRSTGSGELDDRSLGAAARGETLPLEKNYFRDAHTLRRSLETLDAAWAAAGSSFEVAASRRTHARSAVAMTATARWMYASALTRCESRGMHRRSDFPDLDPALTRRLLSGGLEKVWTEFEDAPTAQAPHFPDAVLA